MCSSYDLRQIFHAVPFHHGRQIFDNGLAGIRLHKVRRAHADGGGPRQHQLDNVLRRGDAAQPTMGMETAS